MNLAVDAAQTTRSATMLISRRQLLYEYPMPETTGGVAYWIRHKGFPAPVYIRPNQPHWDLLDVKAWFESLPDGTYLKKRWQRRRAVGARAGAA
jgi:hypothetical protein